MDPHIEKYLYYQEKNKEYHDKMLRYKQKIVSLLRSSPPSLVYDVRLDPRTRSGILKKDVPAEVWHKYSTTTPYEVLVVKKRI